jgi:hypothetical protein
LKLALSARRTLDAKHNSLAKADEILPSCYVRMKVQLHNPFDFRGEMSNRKGMAVAEIRYDMKAK